MGSKKPAMHTFVDLSYNEQAYLKSYIELCKKDHRMSKRLLRIFSFLPLVMASIAVGTSIFSPFGFDFTVLFPVIFCIAIFAFLRMLATAEDDRLKAIKELEHNNHGTWVSIVDADHSRHEINDRKDNEYYFWTVDNKDEKYKYSIKHRLYSEWAKMKRNNNGQNPDFAVLMVRNIKTGYTVMLDNVYMNRQTGEIIEFIKAAK